MSSPPTPPPVSSSAAPPATAPPSSAGSDAAAAAAAVAAAAAATPSTWSVIKTLFTVFLIPIIFGIVFAYGAARLSFDKYHSFGWALLDFIFPMFYYPFYAIVLNKPAAPGLIAAAGGALRKVAGHR